MSVAFTKENDSEAVAANVPDRPVSPHPNLVTAAGLAQIEAELAAAQAAHAEASAATTIAADRTAMARATRELRYWSARRASVQLVEAPANDGTVRFASTVTVERDDGSTARYRIVGEDEADPAAGSVSYVSPLARALTGRRVGEIAMVAGREVELIAVE